ncbi:MAG: histidine phosphatase family protein [Leadbetterella sp.]|nr:histidine phosphatase family protein [Leadbetterella sp.]
MDESKMFESVAMNHQKKESDENSIEKIKLEHNPEQNENDGEYWDLEEVKDDLGISNGNKELILERPTDFSVHMIRHSASSYKNYADIEKSNNPTGPMDYNNQGFDLTEQGIEIAKEEAKKFFDQFDSKKDSFIFFSSEEERCLDTTQFYIAEAHSRGFEIISHDQSKIRNKRAEELGGKEMRTVKNLGLNVDNTLLIGIYNPEKYLRTDINWESLAGTDVKKRWEKVREIIANDDRGSWWKNFYKHSAKVKEIFPEATTALDRYEKKFKNLLRLIEFAAKKNKENNNGEKNIRVVGNSHVDVFGYFLNKNFQEENGGEEIEMKNCEEIRFDVNDNGELVVRYRDFSEKIISLGK